MYNAQQEKKLYGELVGTTPFFSQLKASTFFKASKSTQTICLTCPLILCRKKYVANAWNCHFYLEMILVYEISIDMEVST